MNAAVGTMPLQLPAEVGRDLRGLFERQADTALRWRRSTAKERVARILRLRDAVLVHRDELHQAILQDLGKPLAETDLTELLPLLADCSDYRRKLARWMAPLRVGATRLSLGSSGRVQYQPRGRCLILGTWNYPVMTSLTPLVACLGAGNTAIVKPSEVAPAVSAWLARVVGETFPHDEVALVEGDAATAEALLELPFEHVFFTGSPAVGRKVMAAASRHLSSVTLELGGKSPTIVDETADLDLAARNIAWGKFLNNGQTCVAPDHVYVHESVKDALAGKLAAVIRARFGAMPQEQMRSSSLAQMVNPRHTRRVAALVEDARARGARVLCGGSVVEAERFIAPTLLEDVPADAKIMEEEIFGPVLPLIAYRDLEEVVRAINAGPKPLALYLFSRQQAHIDLVLQDTSSGGACINHVVVQVIHGNLPFGGVNNSGIGNYHGIWGFRSFSHERAVVRNHFTVARLFFPPYTAVVHRCIELMLRWLKLW
jgi:aldehyde dehydrogenase (NAD+)